MKTRVARYQADRTNQKFYFVRVYCQLAEDTPAGQIQDAHIESALMHLYSGYVAFLQEISRYYQLNLNQPTLQLIETSLQQRTQVSPEVLRLQQLLKHDFLAEIERAWEQVLYKPIPVEIDKAVEEADDNRLPIIDVMANTVANQQNISTDIIRQWRNELIEVIDSLRESMLEF